MVVLINGSREFSNYSLLEEKCYEILSPFIEKGDKIIIVEGDARGADRLAGRFAKENNFELEIYPADWSLGKQAGLLRNIEMVEGSRFGHKPDILISFNMGTRGTQHTIDYWKSKYPNKPVYEIKC
jgi:hypothetical protein